MDKRDSGVGDSPNRDDNEPKRDSPVLDPVSEEDDSQEEEDDHVPLPPLADLPRLPQDRDNDESEDNDMDELRTQLQAAIDRINVLEAPAQPNQPGARPQVTGSQINQLPEFDGNAAKDIDIWIWNVERCSRQFNWNDETTCASAQGRMTGAAAYWLHAKQLAGVNYNAWSQNNVPAANLKVALLERFKIRINALVAADAVTNLDQKKSESVSDFYDRVIVAVDRKNFSYTTAEKQAADYQVKMLADVFVFFHAGMISHVKSRATSGNQQPTDAASLLASAIQAELYFAKKSKVPSAVEAVEVVRSGHRKPQGKRSPFDIGKVKCFNCNVMGHFSKECTAPRRSPQGKGSPRKSPAKPVYSVEDGRTTEEEKAENDEGGYQ